MTTEVNEKTEKKGTKRQTQMRKNDGDDYALDELPGGVAEAADVAELRRERGLRSADDIERAEEVLRAEQRPDRYSSC